MMAIAASAIDHDPEVKYAVRLKDISVTFRSGQGWFGKRHETRAVTDVSLDIRAGETFSIVGESGSGKSTLGRVICGLLQPERGEVRIAAPDGGQALDVASHVQVVFQDPFSALNPRMTVRQLLDEPLVVHRMGGSAVREQRVRQLIDMVGLSRLHLDRHPHEFSGGQRQRIAIARAIAIGPRILLADEPLSALDVSVQAQIINLLRDLKVELGLTLILISHDLSVVSYVSDHIGVMYAGKLVEAGTVEDVFDQPAHPYTRSLLDAVPQTNPAMRASFSQQLSGSGSIAAQGCGYHVRCAYSADICTSQTPMFDRAGTAGHFAACHRWQSVISAPQEQVSHEAPYAHRLRKYAAQVVAARQQKPQQREL